MCSNFESMLSKTDRNINFILHRQLLYKFMLNEFKPKIVQKILYKIMLRIHVQPVIP